MNKINFRSLYVTGAMLMAILMLMALFGMLNVLQAQAAPTPSSREPGSPVYPIYFYRAVIDESGAGTLQSLATHNVLDLQWIIVMSETNTTTLKLQYSNDGINWADGVNLAVLTASGNGMNQFDNFGRYTRIYATVVNTYPVTLTVIGVAK